ncbi:MAG: hypothetical protein GYA55_01845 [SAR324 cluster bacterium]|uniref:DUF4402 domain-containing protein n=1 Tax=SAR324 cluster bacterium TaxID=2024889 RepID=A0A7X9FPK2_9DELT|nr:hypothetical protein [SAR324 cluster bacterium]
MKDLFSYRLLSFLFSMHILMLFPFTVAAQSVTVSLTIPTQQQIFDVSDIDFGSYTGSGNPSEKRSVCIRNNTATGYYNISAKGSGTSDAFTVTNGSNPIAYKVYWYDNNDSRKDTISSPNSTLSNRIGATIAETCSSGNASIEIEFQKSALMQAPAGYYSGTIHLMLSPPSS